MVVRGAAAEEVGAGVRPPRVRVHRVRAIVLAAGDARRRRRLAERHCHVRAAVETRDLSPVDREVECLAHLDAVEWATVGVERDELHDERRVDVKELWAQSLDRVEPAGSG
jgi:hypothetical protein